MLSHAGYIQLTKLLLSLPQDLTQGSALSEQILATMHMVRGKLVPSADGTNLESDVRPKLEERCSICNLPIPFESLRWSRCGNGHRFSRCALTFLSILQAGASKACGICGVQYLNENAMPEMRAKVDGTMVMGETQDAAEGFRGRVVGDWAEPRVSLARLLFAACERCLLCGGRFVV